jgi:hypothetical protein
VHKDIVTLLAGNEAEAPLSAEELHSTCRQSLLSSIPGRPEWPAPVPLP